MKKIISIASVFLLMTGLSFTPTRAAEPKKIPLKATASSMYSTTVGYHPMNTVDDKYQTYWLGGAQREFWWIKYDAGEVRGIDKVNIIWYSSYYIPTDYDIQISDDGSTWENVYSNLTGTYDHEGEEKDIGRDARYIRLYIRSVNGGYYCVLREFTAFASSNLPRTVRFQGVLKDKDGVPLDGRYAVKFRLYAEETNGASEWEETQTLDIENGALDVELGKTTPVELSFTRQYWLGVEVESDGEMTPRFKLTSVPYAFKAVE